MKKPSPSDNLEIFYAKDRQQWRRWLEENHETSKGVWLLFYKKGSKMPHPTYNEAVEEAICFGWVDSQDKSLDEMRYVQRFTPRKPKSNWSASNKERVKKMIEEGKMTPAGMAAVERAKKEGTWVE
jgi:uncharacterized protein YdeI (YjbR/CyaY-like superfamily)